MTRSQSNSPQTKKNNVINNLSFVPTHLYWLKLLEKYVLEKHVKWKILILDSAAVICSMVKLTLESDYRFKVDIASTITEASNLEQQQSYDLIIVDFINDTEMSGLEFIEEVRRGKQNSTTFCIVLSNEDYLDNEQQAKQLNLKAWLKKPFTPVGLMNTISKILEPSTQTN